MSSGSFHVKRSSGPHLTISNFADNICGCICTFETRLCAVVAQNKIYPRPQGLYSGGLQNRESSTLRILQSLACSHSRTIAVVKMKSYIVAQLYLVNMKNLVPTFTQQY